MSYITFLPTFGIVVCRTCKVGIPPKDPLRHYELNHTFNKQHPVPMNIRRKIAEYMATLTLVNPANILSPNTRVPELKLINGFHCKVEDCGQCGTTTLGMQKHALVHGKPSELGRNNWEAVKLQTFFEGIHRRYTSLGQANARYFAVLDKPEIETRHVDVQIQQLLNGAKQREQNYEQELYRVHDNQILQEMSPWL
jgi:hypothetical protein